MLVATFQKEVEHGGGKDCINEWTELSFVYSEFNTPRKIWIFMIVLHIILTYLLYKKKLFEK